MNPVSPVTYNEIYFIDRPGFEPIAIKPRISPGTILWGDTAGQGKRIKIDHIEIEPQKPENQNGESSPETIIVHVNDNVILTLHKLTLKLLNEEAKKWIPECPDFKTDSEMKNYFLNTNFSSSRK